jgi:iron complex transport system substrate-binding protein
MNRRRIIAVLVPAFIAVALAAGVRLIQRGGDSTDATRAPSSPSRTGRRVISVTPAITETIYALGADSQLAGVSRFCDEPPAAALKPKIGDLFNLNYEMIIPLAPDIIFITASSAHSHHKPLLDKTGASIVIIDDNSVNGIIDSIRIIGDNTDTQPAAARLISTIESRLAAVKARIDPAAVRPRVLLLYSLFNSDNAGDSVYACGRGNLYNELIELAGGVNAITSETPSAPLLSTERIVELRPDVIIQLDAGGASKRTDSRGVWSGYDIIPAVRNNRIYVLSGSQLMRPGPRFVETLDAFEDAIATAPVSSPSFH